MALLTLPILSSERSFNSLILSPPPPPFIALTISNRLNLVDVNRMRRSLPSFAHVVSFAWMAHPATRRGHLDFEVLPSHTAPPVGALVISRRRIALSGVDRGRRMGQMRRPRHREPAEGDWICQCGEVNYRSKRECFKCGAPAPPLPPGVRPPSLPGEDPHDWACPCGQMNFRGNVICFKCNQPKPVPPPFPGQEVTLWTCSGCKSVNRSTRKFCFKCFAPSPLSQMTPVKL
ncbi:unnamed protein product [Phytomonas sp. Hart1]|nr:unnamed protein product [Phytomonas sp. Hart1]|eukprot:CCW71351.1 unnamed protein product [Phytomonas sp. isolate Hart1]